MRGAKDESAWAVGYAVALVDEEIVCSNGLEPVLTVNEMAATVVEIYHLSSDDDQAEMANLVGDLKPTDRPSDAIYDAVHEALFGGDWPVTIGDKEFVVGFVAAAKRITGGRKRKDRAPGNKEAAATKAEAKEAEAKKAKAKVAETEEAEAKMAEAVSVEAKKAKEASANKAGADGKERRAEVKRAEAN